MTGVSDADVVKRVLGGDADSFRILVDRHGRDLHRVAYRITGSAHDAEDVVQEALIRAYRQLPSFDGRASLSTWLHRITANCAVDVLRSRMRRPEDAVEEETLMTMPKKADEQEAHARSVDIRDAVARGMEALTSQERTAFVLRHFEGLSIEEIGRALGTKANATKHAVFRAVRKLRQELEPLVSR